MYNKYCDIIFDGSKKISTKTAITRLLNSNIELHGKTIENIFDILKKHLLIEENEKYLIDIRPKKCWILIGNEFKEAEEIKTTDTMSIINYELAKVCLKRNKVSYNGKLTNLQLNELNSKLMNLNNEIIKIKKIIKEHT